MKELLVCYTTVFSVVTQRSLVGRSFRLKQTNAG